MDGASIHLRIQVVAYARVFIGIREYAQPVELRSFDEIAQDFEIGFGLAGETDDHAGADSDARNGGANAFQQLQEIIAVRAALHAL